MPVARGRGGEQANPYSYADVNGLRPLPHLPLTQPLSLPLTQPLPLLPLTQPLSLPSKDSPCVLAVVVGKVRVGQLRQPLGVAAAG